MFNNNCLSIQYLLLRRHCDVEIVDVTNNNDVLRATMYVFTNKQEELFTTSGVFGGAVFSGVGASKMLKVYV